MQENALQTKTLAELSVRRKLKSIIVAFVHGLKTNYFIQTCFIAVNSSPQYYLAERYVQRHLLFKEKFESLA